MRPNSTDCRPPTSQKKIWLPVCYRPNTNAWDSSQTKRHGLFLRALSRISGVTPLVSCCNESNGIFEPACGPMRFFPWLTSGM